MKQFLLIFLCILLASQIFAQNYQLELHLNNGSLVKFHVEDIRKITFDNVTDIENMKKLQGIIRNFQVLQNYPNPFNPTTTIQYKLPKNGKVEIRIYNIKGQLVSKLVSENQTAGTHEVKWDGRDDRGNRVASGMYIYQILFDKESIAKKMILVK